MTVKNAPKVDESKPAEQPAQQPAVADITALKHEILESVKEQQTHFMSTLMEKISNRDGQRKEEYMSVGSDIDSDLKSEVEELGLDDSQTKALISLISKSFAKKAGSLKEEVVSVTDKKMDAKDRKKAAEYEISMKYPDILSKSSKLWKKTDEIIRTLPEEVTSLPEGVSIAVKMAAAELGISPVDLNAVRAQDAITAQGSGGGGGRKDSNEVTEDQLNFAKRMKVDPEKFKAKLKMILDKRM